MLASEMNLRDYQQGAKDGVYEQLRAFRSTLMVLPTGCGKTIVFSHIVAEGADHGRRALILAHREELVDQAADKLLKATGHRAAIEMAERKEGTRVWQAQEGLFEDEPAPNSPADVGGYGEQGGWTGVEAHSRHDPDLPSVVVGTVQSMVRRLDRFDPQHFDLVVVDEAHHAVATTYQKILDHFKNAKVLGVTATPDRGDKVALREAFDSVAFTYEIKEAIGDGWLVPIRQLYVQTDQLDLSKVRTRMGDLDRSQLDKIMSEAAMLHEVAGPTVEHAGDRQCLIFTVSVQHAHLLAEVLREHVRDRWRELGKGEPPDNIVAALDGTASKDERRAVVEAYQRGETQYLCNCALFTEGFDAPATGCVVMARPTKSRSLYAQMLGRGTRPLEELARLLADMTREERVTAIVESAKPDLLVLDFTGDSGKHKLVNAVDVLDGDASEPEINLARGMLERGEIEDALEALKKAREQIAEMERKRLRAQARKGHRVVQVDPFAALGVSNPGEDSWGRTVTEKQAAFLEKRGIPVDREKMSRRQASALIGRLIERQDADRATYKQVNRLIKSGLDPDLVWGFTFQEASKLITELAGNKWRRPPSWDARFGAR